MIPLTPVVQDAAADEDGVTPAVLYTGLVLLDVAFDAVTALDFDALEILVRDVKGTSKGYVRWLPI